MCLAIFQPSGKAIPESHLRDGFKNNPHGAGFMYFDETGKVCTYRTMHFDAFIDEYEAAWALHGQHSPFAIHFRWATHGTQDINNVHPFMMNEHVAVLHNGIIDCIIEDKKMSDTAAFVRDYLGALPRNFQDNEFLFDLVEQYCSGSKLIMLTSDPRSEYSAYIFNERLGNWIDGIWYSNGSYTCESPVVPGFKVIGSAEQSAMAFEDAYSIDACELCGEESVMDLMCYNCESCQVCFLEDEYCKCNYKMAAHSMTDAQYAKYYEE